MPDSPRGCGLFGLEGGGWLLDGEEDGAEQVPAALWGRLVGQPGRDHLAQLGDQLLDFLEPDGVLPEADEITGGVGVFPGAGGGQSPGSSPARGGSTGYAEASSGELWLVEVKQVLISY
jgi:hypothetical protein